jgi:hypothetical protein
MGNERETASATYIQFLFYFVGRPSFDRSEVPQIRFTEYGSLLPSITLAIRLIYSVSPMACACEPCLSVLPCHVRALRPAASSIDGVGICGSRYCRWPLSLGKQRERSATTTTTAAMTDFAAFCRRVGFEFNLFRGARWAPLGALHFRQGSW